MKFFASKVYLAVVVAFVSCRSFNSQENESTLDSALGTVVPFLMTANVENAFDGVKNGMEYDDYAPESSNWSPELAQKKAERVAEVFRAANCPDIVISPEVENQIATDMIVKAASACHYAGYSSNTTNQFPIGVSIFTRRGPPTNVSLIETGFRPLLRLDFADGLTVIGVHLKSQRDGGGELRKKAADAVKLALKSMGTRNVVVAGDFNTDDDILAGTSLTNCSKDAPGTHFYKGSWSKLDKIYATKCGTVDRLKDSFLYKRTGEPYRDAQYKHRGETTHLGRGYSDHIPLYMLRPTR